MWRRSQIPFLEDCEFSLGILHSNGAFEPEIAESVEDVALLRSCTLSAVRVEGKFETCLPISGPESLGPSCTVSVQFLIAGSDTP